MSSLSLTSLRSFDYQAAVSRLLRPQNLTILVKVLKIIAILSSLVFLALAAYFVLFAMLTAKSSDTALRSRVQQALENSKDAAAGKGSAPDNSSVIVQRAIFGPLGRSVQPTAAPTPPPTPLSLTLIGTFLTSGEQPYAIIEDKKKNTQDEFVVGQSIFGQATLKAIFQDRVEILREGKVEVLKLDDLGSSNDTPGTGGVATAGTDEFVVDEAEVDKALENLPLLLTQARAVPYFKEGRAVGLRLFAIKPGSLYEKLGLKNGDILKAINGNSLGDLSQALRLFEQLKQEKSIGVVLEREKQDREFRYQIR